MEIDTIIFQEVSADQDIDFQSYKNINILFF